MGFGASRRKGISVLAVIGGCLGVYVVLASAFHWFVQPTIAKNQSVVADRFAPVLQLQPSVAAPAATTAAAAIPTEPPIRMVKPPQSAAATAAAAAPAASETATDSAPKPAPRKVVRAPRPERRASSPWDSWGGGGSWGGNWGGGSYNRSRGWF
jgi:hypothetical protein